MSKRALHVVVGIVLIAAVLGASGVATAQDQSPPTEPPATNTSNNDSEADHHWWSGGATAPTNGNGNGNQSGGNNNNSGGGSGFFGGGGGFGMSLDPAKYGQKLIRGIANAFMGGLESSLNWAQKMISGFPAPGQPDNAQSWINPQNGLWPGVWEGTKYTMAMASVLFLFSGALVLNIDDHKRRRDEAKQWGKCLLFASLTWVIAPLSLHITNEISLWLAPDASDLLANPGSIAKLGLGLGVGAIVAIGLTAVFAAGVFVLGMIYLLAHLCVFFWPVAFAARTYDGLIDSLGLTFIYTFGVIQVLNIVQAAVLKFLYLLPLDKGGATGPVLSFIAIGASFAFILFYFPKSMLEHANDAASVALGANAGARQASSLGDRAQSKTYETLQQYRDSEGDTSMDDSTPNNGYPANSTFGVQSRSDGSSTTATTGSTGAARAPANPPRTGGDTPSQSSSNGMDGIDAGEWDQQKDRIDYEMDRGLH